MSDIADHQQLMQAAAVAKVREENGTWTPVISREQAEADMAEATNDDRAKLDVAILNGVANELSTLNGMLIGKEGQGGMLREIKDSVSDLAATVNQMEHRRTEQFAKLTVRVTKAEVDINAEYSKLRDAEEWIARQKSGLKATLGWVSKVTATVAAAVVMLVLGKRLF